MTTRTPFWRAVILYPLPAVLFGGTCTRSRIQPSASLIFELGIVARLAAIRGRRLRTQHGCSRPQKLGLCRDRGRGLNLGNVLAILPLRTWPQGRPDASNIGFRARSLTGASLEAFLTLRATIFERKPFLRVTLLSPAVSINPQPFATAWKAASGSRLGVEPSATIDALAVCGSPRVAKF